MENVRISGNYWTDACNNKWASNQFTYEMALVLSASLRECVDCVDCRDCKHCIRCFSCRECENCTKSSNLLFGKGIYVGC